MNPTLLLQIIAVGLFLAPGLLALTAALFGFRWFLGSRSASLFRHHLGYGGTRITYGIIGLLLIGAGTVILLDPMHILS